MVSRQLLACISDSISKRPSISLSEISSKHLDQLTDDTLNPLLGPRPQGGNASERRRLFPCARAFNLNSCPRITGPAVLTLLRHLPKLLRLSITGSKRFFGERADIDVSVPHQATYWNPALLLESLDISRCHQLDGPAIVKLFHALGYSSSQWGDSISSNCPEQGTPSFQLKCLDLEGCSTMIKGSFLVTIARSRLLLESLSLAGLDKVTALASVA